MRLKISLLLVVFVHLGIFAQTHMTLVAGGSSQFIFRGAPIWTAPAMLIGPGFVFFDKLELSGPSLAWSFFERQDIKSLKVGIKYFDDEKPLIRLDDTKRSFRNSRTSSVMAHVEYKYRFGWMDKFHIGALIERELKNYLGLYSLIEFAVPVLPFTSLTLSASFAEKSTNQYIYGRDARSGIGYHEFKLTNMFPFVPWKGRIITSLSHQIVSTGNARHAYLVNGDYKNWQLSSIVMWDVF